MHMCTQGAQSKFCPSRRATFANSLPFVQPISLRSFLTLLLVAVSLLVGWRPLVDTFTLALRDYEHTHILLILPISAALIFMEWPSLRPGG